jgi:hypothetical protein
MIRLAFFIALIIPLVGCGDDSESRGIGFVQAIALQEADVSNARSRCIDNKLPLLEIQRDSCMRDQYWCEDEQCQTIYDIAIINLNNAWGEIHARATTQYDVCMTNPMVSELLGERYCIAEYEQWINRGMLECESAMGFALCPG